MMMIYNSHIFNNSYNERENENENPGMQCPIDLRKQECKASVLCAMSCQRDITLHIFLQTEYQSGHINLMN